MKRVAIPALALGLWAGCGGEPQVPEPVRPVKYAEVQPASAVRSQRFAGTARAGTEARLSFRTGGLIESIEVKAGDRVKAGQRIAALDSRDAVLACERARAALENARVQKANAQSSLTRVRQLYQADNVSLAEYEQAKAGYAAATSSFESAEKSLDLQERQLRFNEIRAPVDGIVTAVRFRGQRGDPGRGAPGGAERGRGCRDGGGGSRGPYRPHTGTETRCGCVSPPFPGMEFAARVREISWALDASSTYPVRVRLDAPSPSIRPGMAGDAEFRFGTGGPADPLVVPVKAVGEDASGRYVFVIDGVDNGVGTVQRRPVRIGSLLADGFVVEEGLAEEELVATAGLGSLMDGMKVRLLESP